MLKLGRSEDVRRKSEFVVETVTKEGDSRGLRWWSKRRDFLQGFVGGETQAGCPWADQPESRKKRLGDRRKA